MEGNRSRGVGPVEESRPARRGPSKHLSIKESISMSKLFLGIALASTAIWSVPESSVDPVRDTRAEVSECELAEEWVAANLNVLPKTLGEFAEHSVTFRRAIYGAHWIPRPAFRFGGRTSLRWPMGRPFRPSSVSTWRNCRECSMATYGTRRTVPSMMP